MDKDNKDPMPITRRDLFAAAALNGFIARGETNAAKVAVESIDYADTMIAVLDGNHDNGAHGAQS